MSLRDWINSNPTVVTSGAVVILVAALAWIITAGIGGSGGSSASGAQAYFLDLKTGELFKDSDSKLAPIESPNGNQAVRAVVFSCGSCDDKEKRFIGYYQKLPPEMQKMRPKDGTSGGGAPPVNALAVASAKSDGSFHRPPLSDAQLQRLKKEQNWHQQTTRRRGGGGATFQKIKRAPRSASVCSGGKSPTVCNP